jgi:hypothetical protein
MFFCPLLFFSRFGSFMFATIALSLLFSLFFFASLMFLVGPSNNQGSWVHILGIANAETNGNGEIEIELGRPVVGKEVELSSAPGLNERAHATV